MDEKCAEILFIIRNNSFLIFCFICKKDFSRIKHFKTHYLTQHVNIKLNTSIKISVDLKNQYDKEISNIENTRFSEKNPKVALDKSLLCENSRTAQKNFNFTSNNENTYADENEIKHFQRPDIIQQHKEEPFKQLICENPKCDSSFVSIKHLDQHKLTYHPNDPVRPFKCTYCEKGFLCFGSLNAHVKTVHLKTRIRYSCMYCTKSFNILEKKNIHEATHNGLKAYECLYCEKRFCKKQQLQLHTRRNHLKEKRYKCSFCEKEFFDAGEKRKHERVHTGDKPFICVICSESFTVGQKLNNHMVSKHSQNPTFKCEECEKQFFIKDNFKRHKLIHQGEKKFMCEICSKAFYRNRELQSHIRIHKNLKKRKNCNSCGKFFTNLYEYHSHLKVHVYEEPKNLCEFCSESFQQLNALRKHIKKEHLCKSEKH